MSQGAEATQTLESSASTHTLTIEGRAVSAQAVEIIASFITSKKCAAVAAGRRTGLSAADTPGNLNSATWNAHASMLDVGNSMHVLLRASFSVAGASAVVALAIYDGAATPAYIGPSRDYTLLADTAWTVAGSGQMYPSTDEPPIVDVGPGCKVVALLKSISSGSVDILIEPM